MLNISYLGKNILDFVHVKINSLINCENNRIIYNNHKFILCHASSFVSSYNKYYIFNLTINDFK